MRLLRARATCADRQFDCHGDERVALELHSKKRHETQRLRYRTESKKLKKLRCTNAQAQLISASLFVGRRLVAETGADGTLVPALGATAAEHSGPRLGLHAGKEAVGLGAVAAVGLKGTLRHDKNSCGRRGLLL